MACHETIESVGFALALACKAHRSAMDTGLRALDLHVGQEMILMRLWESEGQTQSELAEKLAVEPPTVTRMIQRMEQDKLLIRHPDAEDARIQRVCLTPKGRELRQQVEQVWAKIEADMIQGLTQEERMLLRRLLLQVRQNLA
jgi:MarR family transcriptional regulator, organic hydroperoxide resistance regulator